MAPLDKSWLFRQKLESMNLDTLGILGQKTPCPQIFLFIQIIDWNLAEESLSVWGLVSCRCPWIFGFGNESKKKKEFMGQSAVKCCWCCGLCSCRDLSETICFKNITTKNLKPRLYTQVWGRVSTLPSPRTRQQERTSWR